MCSCEPLYDGKCAALEDSIQARACNSQWLRYDLYAFILLPRQGHHVRDFMHVYKCGRNFAHYLRTNCTSTYCKCAAVRKSVAPAKTRAKGTVGKTQASKQWEHMEERACPLVCVMPSVGSCRFGPRTWQPCAKVLIGVPLSAKY